jgi:hypothetical protein
MNVLVSPKYKLLLSFVLARLLMLHMSACLALPDRQQMQCSNFVRQDRCFHRHVKNRYMFQRTRAKARTEAIRVGLPIRSGS